jgi:hypothetical protein
MPKDLRFILPRPLPSSSLRSGMSRHQAQRLCQAGPGIEYTFGLPVIRRAYATFTSSSPNILPWSKKRGRRILQAFYHFLAILEAAAAHLPRNCRR